MGWYCHGFYTQKKHCLHRDDPQTRLDALLQALPRQGALRRRVQGAEGHLEALVLLH